MLNDLGGQFTFYNFSQINLDCVYSSLTIEHVLLYLFKCDFIYTEYLVSWVNVFPCWAFTQYVIYVIRP